MGRRQKEAEEDVGHAAKYIQHTNWQRHSGPRERRRIRARRKARHRQRQAGNVLPAETLPTFPEVNWQSPTSTIHNPMSSCLLLFNNQSISQLTITNVENPRQPGPPANTEQPSVKSGVRGGSGFVPVAGCGVKRTMGWGRGEMMEMDGVRHGVKVESLEPPLSTLPFVLPGFSPLSLSLSSAHATAAFSSRIKDH